jgi:uncharacterized protein (UPF0210 family)
MNIRSLTVGAALPQDEAARAELIDRLGSFAQAGRAALENSGFGVQTTRFSTQPLEQWIGPLDRAHDEVARLGELCARSGLDYCSLGTVQAATAAPGEVSHLLETIPDLLMAAGNVFASVQVGSRTKQSPLPNGEDEKINMEAVRASARIIKALSERTADGFGNLRFAAAANCPPHIPFFPASYYEEDDKNGSRPEFGLALEAAGLAVRAFSDARTQGEARANLLALLVDEGGRAAEICGVLSSEHGYTFTGLDISMAPYPKPELSIARALEMISGAPLGSPGTLSAAAFFTGVLKEARAQLPTVGYSGLMLPVLEDQVLADRAAEGLITLDTLLLLSTICGLGLDTVPLPGDVSLRQLEGIILDVATLANRFDKPLTARLLPVPGKSAGDSTEWADFHYFTKGRVMRVPGDNSDAGHGMRWDSDT